MTGTRRESGRGTRPAYSAEPGCCLRSRGRVIDISERKRAQQAQQMMIRELQHRTQNLFAVFQAIASRTADESRTAAEVKYVLNGRLQALGLTWQDYEADLDRAGAADHQPSVCSVAETAEPDEVDDQFAEFGIMLMVQVVSPILALA